MDVTANCICEIDCLALDGFDLNPVHKLISKEKKSRQSWDSNPGQLGGKQECFLCAAQPPKVRKKLTNCLSISNTNTSTGTLLPMPRARCQYLGEMRDRLDIGLTSVDRHLATDEEKASLTEAQVSSGSCHSCER